ncbi:MAG TPA: DUF2795 domain-containing protein [Thermomicrobiales bacterium]|nr:DUF2795 domain-containing protein [Thermomicrobiales bacterium]
MTVSASRDTAERAYYSRALQYLTWLTFPATKAEVLAHFTRKNTPMELIEDTLTLPDQTFATPAEFAAAATAVQRARPPHSWTSMVLPS